MAGVGNAFALIAFYRAAELGPMSIVAPLGALGAVVPVLLGAAQGESIGPVKVLAIVIALSGVALAARPPARGRRRRRPRRPAADPRRAAGWALLSSLGFGVFLAGMAEAGSGGPFWAIALSRASLLALYVVVAVRLASPLRVAAPDVPRVMVPGLLLFAGTLLYTVATREGDLSVVSVIASLAPVVIVALAFTLLGERLARPGHRGRRGARGLDHACGALTSGVVGLAEVPAAPGHVSASTGAGIRHFGQVCSSGSSLPRMREKEAHGSPPLRGVSRR